MKLRSLPANQVIVKLCLCMPLEDILAYTKVCKAYFTFLELLMRNHTATFIELDTPVKRRTNERIPETQP